ALRAVRYFHNSHPGVLSEKDIMDVVSILVRQPDIADIPIEYLRQWRCWTLTDQILPLFQDPAYDIRIVKRNIVRYALECPQVQEKQFVTDRQKTDAEAVREVDELLKAEAAPAPAKP